MHPYMKRFIVTLGTVALVLSLAFVALSTTTQQIGLSGKQVYTYDQATGFARMEVIMNGLLSTFGVATAAAPTWTEGASAYFSFDLSGNLRTTLGTLLSGEDQTNNLLMTSGGAVRSTTMGSAITTDTTQTAVALPTGSKSIYASLTGTGAITQTIKIYGGITSGVTTTTGILLCTLTLSGTTAVYDACPVITANFLYYVVNTSSTTGTSASGTVTAMY